MQTWQKVWRQGICPLLNRNHLEVLREALIRDEPELLQGMTTNPPPLYCTQDWPCEGSCGLTYMGWRGDKLQTVGECEEFFSRLCLGIDNLLGEPAGCRWFINWHDETPREQMRQELVQEINYCLANNLVGN